MEHETRFEFIEGTASATASFAQTYTPGFKRRILREAGRNTLAMSLASKTAAWVRLLRPEQRSQRFLDRGADRRPAQALRGA